MTAYGVLGVGEIGAALVTGLCDDVPNPPPVLMSPRGAEAASRLAARCPSTTVADDNQGVVDGADVVLVCLRQADAEGALERLTFREGQVVVSVVAGVSLARLEELVAPATACRAVPMPEVATRGSETPLHPPVPEAVELFERLGGALPLPDDEQYDAVFTVLGTVAPFFEYLGTLVRWAGDHGVPPELARRLVGRSFAGVGETLRQAEDTDFAELVRLYAPPGGGNAQLADALREAGVFDDVREGLSTVHARLTSG